MISPAGLDDRIGSDRDDNVYVTILVCCGLAKRD